MDPLPLADPKPNRLWLHIGLLLLTVVTTTLVGALHYFAFSIGFSAEAVDVSVLSEPSYYVNGLWYSGAVLAILGCHEMGHYLACRYYRVDVSLPYFLPLPPPFLFGTLGAFIRIRQRVPSKIALFDIGIAGPIAGFVVAVPTLLVGLLMSRLEQVPSNFSGLELGEPLAFRAAAWLVWGNLPDGTSINMHPIAFAAWFGLLATAINLFPIGQLDGGHVSFAVLGRRSSILTIVTLFVAIGLTFVSINWVLWATLMTLIVVVMGPHHPPTLNDEIQMNPPRVLLAGIALLMLIVCFTPAPIEPFVTGQ